MRRPGQLEGREPLAGWSQERRAELALRQGQLDLPAMRAQAPPETVHLLLHLHEDELHPRLSSDRLNARRGMSTAQERETTLCYTAMSGEGSVEPVLHIDICDPAYSGHTLQTVYASSILPLLWKVDGLSRVVQQLTEGRDDEVKLLRGLIPEAPRIGQLCSSGFPEAASRNAEAVQHLQRAPP